MAKIVEFVGPPGIGKSTTYEELCKKWTPNNTWVPYNICALSSPNKNTTIKSQIKKLVFKQNLPSPEKKLLKEAREKFIDENPDFINILWNAISNKPLHVTGRDIRYDSMRFMMKICARAQLMMEYNKSKYCVIDEGFIQNITFTVNNKNNGNYYEELNASIELVKKYTDVVFNFTVNLNALLDRIHRRQKRTFLQENLTYHQISERMEDSIQNKTLITEILEEKNIPVYTVDSSKSAQYNCNEIKRILDTLE